MPLPAVRTVILRTRNFINSTAFSQALSADSLTWNTYTLVQSWTAGVLTLPTAPILRIRATWQAANAEAGTITKAFVGHRAGSGDVYDFSTTPVQLFFLGSASGVASAGGTITSDWATFQYDKVSDLLFAWYMNGGTSSDALRNATGLSANINQYYNSVDEAGVVNKSSGYSTASGRVDGITSIEVSI